MLAIGAHPDDVEIGMGGALAKLVADGLRVGILDLTDGEPTPFGTVEERAAESAKAAQVLGITTRVTLDLPNRYLEDTIEARFKVAQVLRELRPSLLFVHYWEDGHPDHVAASKLSESSRFYAKLTKTDMTGEPFYPRKIFYFFTTHIRVQPQPVFIFDVSDHIDVKVESVRCYHSQFTKGPGKPRVFDVLKERARYWGDLVGTRYGEPFASRERLGLKGLGDVIF